MRAMPKTLDTQGFSGLREEVVRLEGRTSRTPVLQEIIFFSRFMSRKPVWAFGTFSELMCGPHGIAAAVDAKNMPPACFLNAPTVLQEIICYLSEHSKTRKPLWFLGLLYIHAPLFGSN